MPYNPPPDSLETVELLATEKVSIITDASSNEVDQ